MLMLTWRLNYGSAVITSITVWFVDLHYDGLCELWTFMYILQFDSALCHHI